MGTRVASIPEGPSERPERQQQQQRVTLHRAIMAVIKAIASDAELSSSDRLTGVIVLIYGWA